MKAKSLLAALFACLLLGADAPVLKDYGVHNPGFEEWLDGAPLYWTPTESPIHFARVDQDVKEGRYALSLAGGAYVYNDVSQKIVATGPLAGRTIKVTAQAKTTEPKTTCVLLIFAGQTYGKLADREWRHPGDGQWHEVQTTMQVPANAQESEFQVVLSHYNSPQAPALFDKVEVTIE